MISDPLRALLEVVRILDELGLAYAIGGSIASSVFGEPRASADADLLVELSRKRVADLVEKLAAGFYVSPEAAEDAVRRTTSFNAIHLDTMYKVDFFVAGSSELDREQLRRRVKLELTTNPSASAYVTAAENIILRKLDWYRRGGGVSDQQWRDVLGVIKIQGGALDLAYLRCLATKVGLDELLTEALGDSGLAD